MTSPTELTVGEYLSATLALNGIDTVFGIPGVHTLELYRGIARANLKHVLVRHEQGAGFAADGYARLSGKPAAAYVISGPGFTNVLTALGQAYTDSVPLLVVASTAARHSLGKQWGALHELRNQRDIAATVTGHAGHAQSAEDVRAHLKHAFCVMRAARARPAYLEIPLDVLSLPAGISPERFTDAPAFPEAPANTLAHAAQRLRAAKAPVIIAGGGAKHAGAELTALVELLGAPCFLTAASKGVLPEAHPLNVGASLPYAASQALIRDADVVLVVGSELAETDHYIVKLPIHGTMIRVDVDPIKLSDQYANDVAILGDSQQALATLVTQLAGHQPSRNAQSDVKAARASITASCDAPTAHLHALLSGLRQGLPTDAALFTDMTQIAYAGTYGFSTNQPLTWFHPSGYGTLGYALPAAVGAKFACPESPVVALAGDFGLQFTLHELMTAVEHQLSIPIVVWNNSALGQIRDDMLGADIPPIGVIGQNPDFQALARAYGAHAIHVTTPNELSAAVKQALQLRGPTVIEVTPTSLA